MCTNTLSHMPRIISIFLNHSPQYLWEEAQLCVTLMCETVKVNYHLIFILLTSDSRALWVRLNLRWAARLHPDAYLHLNCSRNQLKVHFLDSDQSIASTGGGVMQLAVCLMHEISLDMHVSERVFMNIWQCILNPRGSVDPQVGSWPSQQDYSIYQWEMDASSGWSISLTSTYCCTL